MLTSPQVAMDSGGKRKKPAKIDESRIFRFNSTVTKDGLKTVAGDQGQPAPGEPCGLPQTCTGGAFCTQNVCSCLPGTVLIGQVCAARQGKRIFFEVEEVYAVRLNYVRGVIQKCQLIRAVHGINLYMRLSVHGIELYMRELHLGKIFQSL